MSRGNVNGTLKLLTNNMSNGIVPLCYKALDILKLKHPEPMKSSPETLVKAPDDQVSMLMAAKEY